jgi:hypothetical protein
MLVEVTDLMFRADLSERSTGTVIKLSIVSGSALGYTVTTTAIGKSICGRRSRPILPSDRKPKRRHAATTIVTVIGLRTEYSAMFNEVPP